MGVRAGVALTELSPQHWKPSIQLGPGVPHCGRVLRPCGDLNISSCDIRHTCSGQNVEASRNTEVNHALRFRFASCFRLQVGSWSFPDASLPTAGALHFTAAGSMPSVWAMPSPLADVCPRPRLRGGKSSCSSCPRVRSWHQHKAFQLQTSAMPPSSPSLVTPCLSRLCLLPLSKTSRLPSSAVIFLFSS